MLLLYIMLFNPTVDQRPPGYIALTLKILNGFTCVIHKAYPYGRNLSLICHMPYKVKKIGEKYNASLYIACVVVVAST